MALTVLGDKCVPVVLQAALGIANILAKGPLVDYAVVAGAAEGSERMIVESVR